MSASLSSRSNRSNKRGRDSRAPPILHAQMQRDRTSLSMDTPLDHPPADDTGRYACAEFATLVDAFADDPDSSEIDPVTRSYVTFTRVPGPCCLPGEVEG